MNNNKAPEKIWISHLNAEMFSFASKPASLDAIEYRRADLAHSNDVEKALAAIEVWKQSIIPESKRWKAATLDLVMEKVREFASKGEE